MGNSSTKLAVPEQPIGTKFVNEEPKAISYAGNQAKLWYKVFFALVSPMFMMSLEMAKNNIEHLANMADQSREAKEQSNFWKKFDEENPNYTFPELPTDGTVKFSESLLTVPNNTSNCN